MTTNNNNIIALPDELNIKNVAMVKNQIESALVKGGDLVLSGENLRGIDTAGMQLLVSLVDNCKKNSVSVVTVKFSDSIYQFADNIGMDRSRLEI